ncbi:MCP four helix bundle domain-containing protein, partial [Candidatus Symbiopectobacterium sp. NZEC135]|uniref:MCP four helix bundle domain-containing protein n=1 Tax=Candidatus Symbiopectobacterium sp. NZEC135 TaxID=2820471 RepID=UPI002227E107
MNFFKNMSIGNRLFSGFGVLIILTLSLSSLSYFFIKNIEIELEEITEDRMMKVDMLRDIQDILNTNIRTLRDIILLPEQQTKEKQNLKDIIAKTTNTASDIYKKLDVTINTKEGRDLFNQLAEIRKEYSIHINKAVNYAMEDRDDQATALVFGEIANIQGIYFSKLTEFTELQEAYVDTAKQITKDYITKALYW